MLDLQPVAVLATLCDDRKHNEAQGGAAGECEAQRMRTGVGGGATADPYS